MLPLLSLSVVLPLAGVLAIILLARARPVWVHAINVGTTGIVLLISIWIWLRGVAPQGFSQVDQFIWIPSVNAAWRLGIDGLSLPLFMLTAILFFASAVYLVRLKDRPASFAVLFLLLETASLGTFAALDGLLFYVFFELSLVSMYFIIAGWGHEERHKAALMFFIYTLLGSLPLLLAILGLFLGSGSFDMRAWIGAPPLTGLAATLALAGMLFTFAVKTPVFPVHTWLPAAHVQAPTVGSVILAGVMLKFGTYGLVRFAMQMTPAAFTQFAPWIVALGVFSAIYGALAALAQQDIKKMIAYTSVNHMGYVVLGAGIAALATQSDLRTIALDGTALQMVSHGIVTGALFFAAGMLTERTGTRNMNEMGGLLKAVPVLGWAFIVVAFASLGLPGLAHFPAEFQIFLATLNTAPWAVIVVVAIAITAGLYLRSIQRVFLGERSGDKQPILDLEVSERVALLPLLALAVLIGIAPSLVLDVIHPTMAGLLP